MVTLTLKLLLVPFNVCEFVAVGVVVTVIVFAWLRLFEALLL